jgi:hypothetical protein
MNTGFNPITWDCDLDKCFLKKHHPRVEIFAQDFPRNVAFTDVDACIFTVEMASRFLFIEWKHYWPIQLKTGQKLYFERLTALSPEIIAAFVVGHAETMEINHFAPVVNGKIHDFKECSTAEFRDWLRRWAAWAERKTQVAA